jgi:uncharacterized protein (TIGR04255 family)
MGTSRHLRNAPITEAIIDIGVFFDTPRKAEQFADISASIAADYPTREERHQVTMQYNMQQQQGSVGGTLAGYLYRSVDSTQVVQSHLGGFTFSRLKPYRDWDSMFEEAWRLWQIYRTIFKPIQVRRIATRFINRLEFPLVENFDFDHYLTAAPRLPATVPQIYAEFATSVTVPVDVALRRVAVVRTSFTSAEPNDSVVPRTLRT